MTASSFRCQGRGLPYFITFSKNLHLYRKKPLWYDYFRNFYNNTGEDHVVMSKDQIIVITISGRGDKDVAAIARYRGEDIYE